MGKSYKYDPEYDPEYEAGTPTDEFMRRRSERKQKGRWDDEFYQHRSAQSSDKRVNLSPRHMRGQG